MQSSKNHYPQQNIKTIDFPTTIAQVEQRINSIDPVNYAKTRNYNSGAVTYLSPYISRGVISTKRVYNFLKTQNYNWAACEKLIQELAWRDYWQQVWVYKKEQILEDLKKQQPLGNHKGIPSAILDKKTGIDVVDEALYTLQKTGYMHNHMRMYVASLCTNMAQCKWLEPANWMYYNLIDGDIASNHLSWQWVAGANSGKLYVANQENINKYFNSEQRGTFLDVAYEAFNDFPIPEILLNRTSATLKTKIPEHKKPLLENKPTLVYNYYNLDPNWLKDATYQRILLIEPSVFENHPVSEKCINFMLGLVKNIPDCKVFVGAYSELLEQISVSNLNYKEHPLNESYTGNEHERDWISSVVGYYPSFFKFWNKAKKELKRDWNA